MFNSTVFDTKTKKKLRFFVPFEKYLFERNPKPIHFSMRIDKKNKMRID